MVKIVVKNGQVAISSTSSAFSSWLEHQKSPVLQLYLPGGRIPPIREGFSFTSQWASGFLLLDLLNVTDKWREELVDMEFFVSSGAFQHLNRLSRDGSTYPLFSASGSKHFFDLVLPEAHATSWG